MNDVGRRIHDLASLSQAIDGCVWHCRSVEDIFAGTDFRLHMEERDLIFRALSQSLQSHSKTPSKHFPRASSAISMPF